MELACKTHRNNQESVVEELSHSLSDDGGDHNKQQQAVVHSLSDDGGDHSKQQVVEDDDDGRKKLLQEEGDGDGEKVVLRNAWVSMEHCKVAVLGDGKRMMVVESPPGDCCMR